MPKIFISHSWEDNEISRKLTDNLRRDGVEVWIDYERIESGDSLPRRISEALEWCDTLILLWSKTAANSYYVNLEWENALDLKKKILPCLIDNAKRPAILHNLLFIDFNNFEQGYSKLTQALQVKQIIISNLFRYKPAKLSINEVNNMLKKYNFFDLEKNKEGGGLTKQLEIQKQRGDKIIIEKVSGLMWQHGGSSYYMHFESGNKCLEELNRKAYAGYNDWRLPTLEEAMSLMEPNEKKNNLYIDSLFDKEQSRIWTCDYLKTDKKDYPRVWVVEFYFNRCIPVYLDSEFYVLAVRHVQLF